MSTACQDYDSTPTAQSAAAVASDISTRSLASLRELPEAASAQTLVGAEGGELRLGPIRVTIPAGAVEEPTRFSIELPAGDSRLAGLALAEFRPHDVAFKTPVVIEFDLSATSASDQRAYLARWTGAEWQPLDVATPKRFNLARAEVLHFSWVGAHPCVLVDDPFTEEGCPPEAEDDCPACDGIWNGYTESVCTDTGKAWFVDDDHDGVDDYCENALADNFQPLLHAGGDCNHDPPYNRNGGEYYHAVEKTGPMRIAYLPAYYVDCGVPGLGGSHDGDSEFIVYDLQFNSTSNHWLTDSIFTSAHCGTELDGHCKYWLPGNFDWVDGRNRGAARITVSLEKHANFPNTYECNGRPFESCPGSGAPEYRFPVAAEGNIGSRSHPFVDYTAGRFSSAYKVSGKKEYIWTSGTFCGWQYGFDPPCPDTYGDHLASFGF